MSQNSHVLLLFFDKKELFQNCLKMFRRLEAGDAEKAKEYGQQLGVDIAETWNEEWFNHTITPTSKHIRLHYDTSSRYDLPLDVLQQLFAAGLRVACLEVFYDQVGEYGQFYFKDGKLLDKESVYGKSSQIKAIVDEQFESAGEDLEEDGYPRPSSIDALIKEQAKQEKEASELAEALTNGEVLDAMVSLAKASQETGEDPIDVLKSAMLLRAIGKGLLQAIAFGVITVLMFKGMWLWIVLALVLAVVLPIIYILKVNAEFGDDEGSDVDGEEGEVAC